MLQSHSRGQIERPEQMPNSSSRQGKVQILRLFNNHLRTRRMSKYNLWTLFATEIIFVYRNGFFVANTKTRRYK